MCLILSLNFIDFTICFLFLFITGKGQGTPSIRDGIHCIGVDEVDEESETSDWQGFD